MGANLPAKKYSKKSPTTTRLSFECSGGATNYIDVGLALSAMNRKAYRSGLYYYINSVEVYNNETGVVDLHTLPDNWVTKNSWNRALKLFQRMNRLVNSPLTSGIKPKYHDFKVYMNFGHREEGSLSPSSQVINNGTGTVQEPRDWVYSKFVSGDDKFEEEASEADSFTVHMLGGHEVKVGTGGPNMGLQFDSVGLIASYANTRATVPEFTPEGITGTGDVTLDPLVDVFDFGEEDQMKDIISNLATDNDEPPYPEAYIGAEANDLHQVARLGTEVGIGRVARAGGFCAPFGLICVDPFGVSTDFRVVLNLAVGTYHGVHAERA